MAFRARLTLLRPLRNTPFCTLSRYRARRSGRFRVKSKMTKGGGRGKGGRQGKKCVFSPFPLRLLGKKCPLTQKEEENFTVPPSVHLYVRIRTYARLPKAFRTCTLESQAFQPQMTYLKGSFSVPIFVPFILTLLAFL